MKMAAPSSPKILPSLQLFSLKSSNSSTLVFVKFKAFIHTIIFSHLCRLARAISRAKSTVVRVLKKNYHYKSRNKNKIFFGSFRLHYNWCSSHVMPVPDPMWESHFYYDAATAATADTSQLSGYLQWLEERKLDCETTTVAATATEMNEIDKLAEMFIASCHEKFRLEKQESARRFQEMMARSM